MKRFAFITDIHANLPALEAALEKIKELDCETIYVGGDSIGIGPFPAECLTIMENHPKIRFVNGNHELMALMNDKELFEELGEDEEYEHTLWYRSCLSKNNLTFIQKSPLKRNFNYAGVHVLCLHYPYDIPIKSGIPYYKVIRKESAVIDYCEQYTADLILFGHDHLPYLIKDKKTYLNPGSLGCYKVADARFAVIECENGKFEIKLFQIPYNDDILYPTFENHQIPARKFIYKAFFGNRF